MTARTHCASETSRGAPCQRFTRVTFDGVPLCASHQPPLESSSPLTQLDLALVVCGVHEKHELALWLILGDAERLAS